MKPITVELERLYFPSHDHRCIACGCMFNHTPILATFMFNGVRFYVCEDCLKGGNEKINKQALSFQRMRHGADGDRARRSSLTVNEVSPR